MKARGDGGSGRTELLTAFAALCRQFGMTTVLVTEKNEHLIVTSTKAQREKLWRVNHESENFKNAAREHLSSA